jgi:hypothetical protein
MGQHKLAGLKAAKERRDKIMGFKIIRAFDGGCKTRVGRERDYHGGKHLARTLDDDKNICYHAHCDDDEGMEDFHDYSVWDVGATHSEYREDGEWKPLIG